MKTPFIIVLTKSDKSTGGKIMDLMKLYQTRMEMFSPIIFATSAKTDYGIPELRAYLAYCLYNMK
jgi:selenocysteine-specific translation elongation factor